MNRTIYKMRQSTVTFSVLNLISIYDTTFPSDYKVKGETHNFWELIYIQSGVVGVTADTHVFKLHQGQCIFHKPGEFHNIWSSDNTNPHVFIITFTLDTPLKILEHTISTLSNIELQLINLLIQESHALITINDSSTNTMWLEPICDLPYALDQTLRDFLELFIIHIIRNNNLHHKKTHSINNPDYTKVTSYIQANLFNKINISMICEHCQLSETVLKKLVRTYMGMSVMEYVNHMKIIEAIRLLDEGISQNEIAHQLGFSSPYYFSTSFKRITGIPPSHYKLQLLESK